MNKERRKKLKKIQEPLEEVMQDLEYIREEEASLVNIPGNFQSGENNDKAEATVSSLEEVVNNIEAAIE